MPDSDPKLCPLCHRPNGCGIADFANCWCRSTPVPRELLATLPADQRNRACICRACVEAWTAAHPAPGSH